MTLDHFSTLPHHGYEYFHKFMPIPVPLGTKAIVQPVLNKTFQTFGEKPIG